MRVMHWREEANVSCGFTLLPSANVYNETGLWLGLLAEMYV